MQGDYNRAESLISEDGNTASSSRKNRFIKVLIFVMSGLALFAYFSQEEAPLFAEDTQFRATIPKKDGTCKRVKLPNGSYYLLLDGKAHLFSVKVGLNLFKDWNAENAASLSYPVAEAFNDDTKLVASPGYDIYLLVNGKLLRKVVNTDTFNACGFNNNKLSRVYK